LVEASGSTSCCLGDAKTSICCTVRQRSSQRRILIPPLSWFFAVRFPDQAHHHDYQQPNKQRQRLTHTSDTAYLIPTNNNIRLGKHSMLRNTWRTHGNDATGTPVLLDGAFDRHQRTCAHMSRAPAYTVSCVRGAATGESLLAGKQGAAARKWEEEEGGGRRRRRRRRRHLPLSLTCPQHRVPKPLISPLRVALADEC